VGAGAGAGVGVGVGVDVNEGVAVAVAMDVDVGVGVSVGVDVGAGVWAPTYLPSCQPTPTLSYLTLSNPTLPSYSSLQAVLYPSPLTLSLPTLPTLHTLTTHYTKQWPANPRWSIQPSIASLERPA